MRNSVPELVGREMSVSLLQRFAVHIAAAFATALLLTLPDMFYKLLNPAYKTVLNYGEFSVLVLISFLLLGIYMAWLRNLLLGFFALLQLSQLLHFSFFGSLVSPHVISLLFSEWREIWETLAGIAPFIGWPLLFMAIAYGGIVLLWRRALPYQLNLFAPFWILTALLAILPVKAATSDTAQRFYPDPRAFSIKNTLYALSYFIGHDLPNHVLGHQSVTYVPYERVAIPFAKPVNIVVVMGESLTYKHLSLYGYARETTPNLSRLRDDPNFIFLPAIAGGVATKVSLPLFFNVQREPDNFRHMYNYETNLFKMAKEQGLATHFISVQDSNLSTYSGAEFVDNYVTRESLDDEYQREMESLLVRRLGEIDLSRSNFIVLHQRNSHSPYPKSYPPEFEKYPVKNQNKHDYMVNSYDNSVRYTDHILSEMLRVLRENSRVPTYFFFTSDHGEMMGEGGKYGHVMLEPDVARVPFLFWSHNGDPAFVASVKALDQPTHYQIAKTIARLLGNSIVNPNEDGRFFVNGPNLDGSAGYLVVEPNGRGEPRWRSVAELQDQMQR